MLYTELINTNKYLLKILIEDTLSSGAVLQSSKEELEFSFILSSCDNMEDKCDHPAELLGTVHAQSSVLSQSENGVSEPLETADVDGGTEHDGSPARGHAGQTDEGKRVAA
jgi:hypothetical protein